MLPVVRKRLKSVSSRNQSLQDILLTSFETVEILSIKSHTTGIHNTELTVRVDLGVETREDRYQERVQFYNRIIVQDIIKNLTYVGTDLKNIINQLNLQGCDFTEDDLEIVDGQLKAKSTSLGYCNRPEIKYANCLCIMDHQTFNFSDLILPSSFHSEALNVPVVVDGYIVKFTVQGIQYQKEANVGDQLSTLLTQIMDEQELHELIYFDMNQPGLLFIQNLNSECNNIAISVLGKVINEPGHLEVCTQIAPFELCPVGERKLLCDGLSKTAGFGTNLEILHKFPTGLYTLEINNVKDTIYFDLQPIYTVRDILDRLSIESGLNHYYSITDGSRPYFRYIENTTNDCLSIKLSYRKLGDDTEHIIFKTLIGIEEGLEPAPVNIRYPSGTIYNPTLDQFL